MKSLFKNSLFYVCLILFLGAGFLAVDFVKATTSFSEPSESYPGGIPEIPIDTGDISQTKEGDLVVEILKVTSTQKEVFLHLKENGIWMWNNLQSRIPEHKLYWDDITSWSEAGDGIYSTRSVNIGTDSLSPEKNVILNIDGRLDMRGNRIINVGQSASTTDVATRGYVDPKFGIEVSGEISRERDKDEVHATLFLRENESEAKMVYGDVWDISTELGTSEWDFCFLTKVERDSSGTDADKLRVMACEVMKGYGYVNADGPLIGDGGWYLRVATDKRNYTRCAARCVNFK